jgi:hypothetical protein
MARRRRRQKQKGTKQIHIPAQETTPIADKPSWWRRLWNFLSSKLTLLAVAIFFLLQGKGTSGIAQILDLDPRFSINTRIPAHAKIDNTEFTVKNEGKVYLYNLNAKMKLLVMINSAEQMVKPHESEEVYFSNPLSSLGTISPGDSKSALPLLGISKFGISELEAAVLCVDVSFGYYYGFLTRSQQDGFIVNTRSDRGRAWIPEWTKVSCDTAKDVAKGWIEKKIPKKP